MRWSKAVTVIGAHAEGEVGRVLTGGVLDVPGKTTLEKMQYLQTNDELRQFVNREPRGCAQMTTNLLLPASAAGADAAFVPMQADGTHAMSGSNAMCVTTVLLETGILPMKEPETTVVLDSAAGLVRTVASCRDGRGRAGVTLDFFPVFAEHVDAKLEVEGLGTLTVDVAYGGAYYVLPRAQELGFRIGPGCRTRHGGAGGTDQGGGAGAACGSAPGDTGNRQYRIPDVHRRDRCCAKQIPQCDDHAARGAWTVRPAAPALQRGWRQCMQEDRQRQARYSKCARP